MACRMRMWNPEWYSPAIDRQELFKPDVHGRKSHTYIEIMYSGTNAATTTQVGGAGDAGKDGTAAPFVIVMVSNSGDDDNDLTNKDLRKVRVLGVSCAAKVNPSACAGTETDYIDDWATNNQYSVEEINMNGTADVYSIRYYIRVMHVYGCDWGSAGQNAKGTVQLESPANTVLFTIAAGANESQGSTIFGSYGHTGRLTYLRNQSADVADNTN